MILGRTRDASEEVADEAEVVCSVRIVVLCAIQAYRRGVSCDDDDDEDAIMMTAPKLDCGLFVMLALRFSFVHSDVRRRYAMITSNQVATF